MMTGLKLHFFRLSTLALALSAPAADAGVIDTKPAYGDAVVAVLNGDSKVFVDAFRIIMPERSITGPFTGVAKTHLFKATKQATIARMDYTYVRAGRTYVQTYYARSGPAMEVTFRRMTTAKQPKSDGGSGGGSSGSYVITEPDIALDKAEREYYPKDTSYGTRARNLLKKDGGVEANDPIHEGDAELKIFRKIEADIEKDLVTPGGRLVGYVSKSVCSSCKAAAKTLATTHDIDGTLYELLVPGAEPASDAIAAESTRLSGVLRRRRDAYLSNNVLDELVPLDKTSRVAADPIERIEAEEARQTIALPCGD